MCREISKARRLLGFDPKVELEDGLKTTIRWQIGRRRALGMPTPDLKLPFEDAA